MDGSSRNASRTTATSFMPSPLYIMRGAIFVWSHKTLWKYAAAPIIVSMAILGGSYALLYNLFVKWMGPHMGTEWYSHVLYYVLLFMITVALLAAFFFIFTRLASAVAAPFNDLISLKTEELVCGTVNETPFSLVQLFKDSGRLLLHSFRLLGLYLGLLIVGLVLLLIPTVGGILYTAFGVFVSAYMFAYEYLGYPMDRRRYSWAAKRGFLRSKFGSALGFGLGTLAVAAIPIVNFVFIPAAVAGGTLLFLDLKSDSSTNSTEKNILQDSSAVGPNSKSP